MDTWIRREQGQVGAIEQLSRSIDVPEEDAMTTSTFARRPTALVCLVGAALALGADQPGPQATAPAKPPGAKAAVYNLAGPYRHANLTIFLICGEDQIKHKTFLTLKEALEQKKVIVYETKNVNELAIENVSPQEEVFVQAGDIVKGGQQDRVIAFDLIVPAKSGKMPLAAFCVEAGRWTRRGAENAAQFERNFAQAPTKDLKLAVRQEMRQDKVWENVAKAQGQLGRNLGQSVNSAQSATSLQLTLENKKLQEATEAYVKKLAPILEGKDDVIGYAFAVNGEINSADVYVSHGLFVKLWPMLLKGSVVEAISEMKKDKKFTPPTMEAVKAFLADGEKGKTTEKEVTKRIRVIQHETKENISFECRDQANPTAIIRRNYLKK
jgi:hypothetical protein